MFAAAVTIDSVSIDGVVSIDNVGGVVAVVGNDSIVGIVSASALMLLLLPKSGQSPRLMRPMRAQESQVWLKSDGCHGVLDIEGKGAAPHQHILGRHEEC